MRKPMQEGEKETPELFDAEGRIIIFTDGSRKGRASYPWLQRGGSGVWFGPGHRHNLRVASRGPDPSSQRSELSAGIYALEIEDRPSEIRSDSAWALSGAWALQGGAGMDDTWQLVELWHRLRTLIHGRDVRSRKVRARVSNWETQYNSVLAEDTRGNNAVDGEAKDGADLLQLPWEELEKVRKNRAIQAGRTHRMMIAVMESRQEQLDERRKTQGWPLGRRGVDGPPDHTRKCGDAWDRRPEEGTEHSWGRVAECITLAAGCGRIASYTKLSEQRIIHLLGQTMAAQWATTKPPLRFGTTWAEA